jgi:hypothetical protein
MLEVCRWVIDHRHAVRAEHAHECSGRQACEFGTLADANSVKPYLFDNPQQPQLVAELSEIGFGSALLAWPIATA